MDLNMDQCSHVLKFSLLMIEEYPGFGLFHCVTSLISCLTATFGNSIIICAFRKASSMTPASRILLLSVAASDLGVGLFVQPVNTAIMIRMLIFRKIHGGVANGDLYMICPLIKTWQFLSIFFAGASLLTVGAISIDRFLALYLHLRYRQIVTVSRVVAVVSGIWMTAFLTAVLQTLTVFNDIINLTGELLVLIMASFAYIMIYKIALRHHNQIYGQAQLQNQTDQVTQLSRAKKLAINSLYIYVIIIICYVPSLCISLIFTMARTPGSLLTLCYYLGASLVFLNSSLNPLVYCWKLREVREAAVDILKNLFSKFIPCSNPENIFQLQSSFSTVHH